MEAGLWPPCDHPRKAVMAALRPDTTDARRTELRQAITHEQWRGLKRANDDREAELISRASVAAVAEKIEKRLATLLKKKLLQEYPAAVAGLDVPGARAYGKRLNDEIRAEVQSWASLWGGK